MSIRGDEPDAVPDTILPIALCVFRRGDAVLVAEGYDAVVGETFYRPVGGRIEPGERSQETVSRELQEELRAEVRDLRLLDVIESIFKFRGQPRHEVVFLYEGSFPDPVLYDKTEIEGLEADGRTFRAVWKSLDEFRSGRAKLYPEGLFDLLSRQ